MLLCILLSSINNYYSNQLVFYISSVRSTTHGSYESTSESFTTIHPPLHPALSSSIPSKPADVIEERLFLFVRWKAHSLGNPPSRIAGTDLNSGFDYT